MGRRPQRELEGQLRLVNLPVEPEPVTIAPDRTPRPRPPSKKKKPRKPPPRVRIPRWTAERLRAHFAGVADSLLVDRFIEYHLTNEDVYQDFVARAFRARRTGRTRYSQWTIIQSVRWDRDMKTHGDVFKVNNDFIALYVRMAMEDFPAKLGSFFEIRRMKPSGRKMSREESRRHEYEEV